MMRPRSGSRGPEGVAATDGGTPEIVFSPHSVEVIERAEGYREFRCLPATWSYAGPRSLRPLLCEFYSQRMGVDPYGLGLESEFWSGSDAALRLRSLPRGDLAARELHALASRRSTGLNAPEPWASQPDVDALAAAWEPEATDIHFSQYPSPDEPSMIWDHFGMARSDEPPVVFGYGQRESRRPLLGRSGASWEGGVGTWYSWSELRSWDRWPRRQELQRFARGADPGNLLLFVSHRWESLDHPDPTGRQLQALKLGLNLALAAAVLRLSGAETGERTSSGLPELIAQFLDDSGADVVAQVACQEWAREIKAAAEGTPDEQAVQRRVQSLEMSEVSRTLDRIRDRILLWHDYASMFQAPRTPTEEEAFRTEILELNSIQGGAATLVIAGDAQYLSRAWCFLELCAGMRGRIVELTPSWGTSVGVGDSVTRWASRSDQLIGALATLGADAISHSGLQATHPEDLPAIARLLGALPLTGLVETDDSDLIGGAFPLPFRSGEWMFPDSGADSLSVREYDMPSVLDFGRVPSPVTLLRVADQAAGADKLGGAVGAFVYTTQRTLTLAWAARAREFLELVGAHIAARGELGELEAVLGLSSDVSVACVWADARSLADNGLGWTRVVPSTVQTLFIVTQSDLPDLSLIYERIVRWHVACAVPVVTYMPETGRLLLHGLSETDVRRATGRRADVLAVPRLRRSEADPRRMFTSSDVGQAEIEVLASLRLDPADGIVSSGRVVDKAAAEGFGNVGDEITPATLLTHSEGRVRAEALARSTAATWDEWCSPRVNQSYWRNGMAPLQLHVIEQLVRKALKISDNPFKRRRLLDVLVRDHEGYALPPWILEQADALIESILEDERAPREP
jgi:hypothetical protein